MTGREVLAHIRPLEGFAETVRRFGEIAHEAIRLEEGLAATATKLDAERAALADVKAEKTRVAAEVAGLERRMAAERDAALAALAHETEERRGSIEATLAHLQGLVSHWEGQALAAQTAFEAKRATMVADEAAMESRLADLRAQAKRMLRAAEDLR